MDNAGPPPTPSMAPPEVRRFGAGLPLPIWSMGTKLAGATIVLIMLVTAVVYDRLSKYQRENLLQAKETAAAGVTRLFADFCAAPIVFGDTGAIDDALGKLGRGGDVPYAAVWSSDDAGRPKARLSQFGPGQGADVDAIPNALVSTREAERLVLRAPVLDVESHLVGVTVVTFSLAHENQLIAGVRKTTLSVSAAIAAGLTLLLLAIARFAIVRPLSKLVVAANRIERGEYIAIDVHSRDEIGQLAGAFRSMSEAITNREERIQSRNRDMRLVLDNVGQGFLTLDIDGHLSEERSRVVQEWFGEPKEGVTFWQYIKPFDAKTAERFEFMWLMLEDDFMPLEVTIDQLPRLFHAADRVFELAYRPILDNERLSQLLVVITDVSARIEREKAELAEREMMSVFQHINSDRSAFEQFFEEASSYVQIVLSDQGSDVAGLKRAIHTLKGNSALYNLESVAQFCHHLEDELLEEGALVTEHHKQELRKLWDRIRHVRAQFSTDDGIHIDKDEYDEVLEAALASAPPELARRITAWRFEPASRRLALLGRQIQKLSQRLGKGKVQIVVHAGNLRLPPRKWAPVWAALGHVLRNTVDHGLELPEAREQTGKPLEPTVSFAFRRDEREIVLSIQDDGQGIDWVTIAERGRSLGLPVDTPEQQKAALFAQGVSTKTSVTEVSGRGVGLNAVLEVVTSSGGHIELESARGHGTRFSFHFPLSMLTETTNTSTRRPPVEMPPLEQRSTSRPSTLPA